MPLKRSLNLVLVSFYGLGTIIGAGIYALIGSVIQEASQFTPFSFLIASFIAFFSAASYMELSSRFPKSAGSAYFVWKAFQQKWLSGIVGWLMVCAGIVSSATLVHGMVNYVEIFFSMSPYIIIPIVILILGSIAILGITQSSLTILVMTLFEIFGLCIVIWYGRNSFQALDKLYQYIPLLNFKAWLGIFSGALIAFYAFIGFEDIVNLSEETKTPKKTIPYAIFIALIGATILYLLVSFVIVFTIPYKELSSSKIPLTMIIKQQNHGSFLFILIAMLAIINGILAQIIVSSRLIYGMTEIGNAPKWLGKIYNRTQIPLLATLIIMLAIVIMAYWFPIQTLAKVTSTLMLFIFMMIHITLIIIKLKKPHIKAPITVPIFFPVIGLLLLITFLLIQLV